MQQTTRWSLPVLLALLLALLGAALAPAARAQGMMGHHLALAIDGLEPLGDGYAYEGWLIIDGEPVSTGTFDVNADGSLSQERFDVMADTAAATTFVLTIEPSPDPDPAPSAVHVLGGDLDNGYAELTVAHPAALGSDFSGAAGSYILAAPSGGDAASYANGIWWLDPDGPSASLVLPTLPEGWIYEGWVVGPDGPVSTGRFAAPSGADSDGKGPAAGAADTPPFPGQDFVSPAKDLTGGYAAVISVEPVPDDSPAPFALKPLLDGSIDDVGAMTAQAMSNNRASFPTGSATLDGDMMMEGDDEEAAATSEASGGAVGPAPQTMPETGATVTSSATPLLLLAAGLLLLTGATALRRRPR